MSMRSKRDSGAGGRKPTVDGGGGTLFEQAVAAAGLPAHFRAGLGAVDGKYRAAIRTKDSRRVTGSVDMDAAFKAEEPHESRWDYGVGLRLAAEKSEVAMWIEPHPASSTGEAAVMLRKHQWLLGKLKQFSLLCQLTDSAGRAGLPRFVWLVVDGDIHITPQSRQAKSLAMAGLSMPKRYIDLP